LNNSSFKYCLSKNYDTFKLHDAVTIINEIRGSRITRLLHNPYGAIIIFPEIEKTIIPACYAPIAIDEIALGFWLLFKGANIPKMES